MPTRPPDDVVVTDYTTRRETAGGGFMLEMWANPKRNWPPHEVYWGSHGCARPVDHEGACWCDCCDCEDHPEPGCVAGPPYYGPDTQFYGRNGDRIKVSLDILFVAYNRLGFTRFSFEQLLVNTDWTLVDRLIVYDDESTDGTRDYLAEAVGDCPVEHEIRDVVLRSPPGVMNHYLQAGQAEWFAKIDNDIVVPPGWLTAMLSVLAFHPEVDLLGMEGGRTGIPGRDGHPAGGYDIELCSHIGGVGLLRREAFFKPGQRTLRRIPQRGRFGFTEWQLQHDDVVRAWIYPDLMVTALDMIPFEPWCGWSEEYIREGWQRRWPTYDPRWAQPLWAWWPEEARTEEAECSTG